MVDVSWYTQRLRAHPDNKSKQVMQHDAEWAADIIERLVDKITKTDDAWCDYDAGPK